MGDILPRFAFPIESDFDVYCCLKASLPPGYEIQSEPSKAYYSEWQFCYRIYRDGRLWREFEGDFRKLEPGALVAEAASVLRAAEEQPC